VQNGAGRPLIVVEDRSRHELYMRRCIELARRTSATGDAPVGALVVLDDRIVGEGVEAVKARADVTAHAEIEALRAACAALGSTDLTGSTLYTSVEPCLMCAYAIRLARVSLLVTGAHSPEEGQSPNGWTVLTQADVLPSRPVPLVIRDVLAGECQSSSFGA
jgi:tRNA(adenine34) deaminase